MHMSVCIFTKVFTSCTDEEGKQIIALRILCETLTLKTLNLYDCHLITLKIYNVYTILFHGKFNLLLVYLHTIFGGNKLLSVVV